MQALRKVMQVTPPPALVEQVRTRRDELMRALYRTQLTASTRADIEHALAVLDLMMSGDLGQLSDMVSRDLTAWLETNKFLGLGAGSAAGTDPAAAAAPTLTVVPAVTAEDANQPPPTPVVPDDVSFRT
ncbi:MAG TPA: hypothetical protein VHE35_31530 [Kofleriaceae bacterium]|nr:hypothetical protein [Kofleriaceae bacterium]